MSPPTNAARQVVEAISKASFTILEDDSCLEDQLDPIRQDQLDPIRQECDEAVFDDSISSAAQITSAYGIARPRRNSSYILRTPPQLRPRSATSYNVPQPSKNLRDTLPPGFPESYLSRPLPDRPRPEIFTDGTNDACVPRSRKSSTASAAPSVAPSLRSYVNNESYLEETVEYGQGLEIPIRKDHPGVALDVETTMSTLVSGSVCIDASVPAEIPGVMDTSTSEFEGSPLITEDTKDNSPTLLSPGNYMATTGSTLESHADRREDKQASSDVGTYRPMGIRSPRKKREDTVDLALDLSRFPHLQLSEPVWTRQIPSPQQVPRRILSPRLGRLWNTIRRNKSRSPLRNIRNKAAPHNCSAPQLSSPEVKERNGKWI